MSRHAGRNVRVYMALASGGTAEPIQFLNSFTFNASTDHLEVTSFGDSNKVYVGGLPDAAGDFGGYYDDASVQTYTAAVDGLPRKAYLYPDIVVNPGQYWHGNILPDFAIDTAVDGTIGLKSSWAAASAIIKVG